ncbi:(2Fe-2S)-binding protein [Variovorax paradoxus]|uniref:2Fe-2S iron-sulfur cluster-binding protein n=1 Tax=Variovorax paradoxus TaxID=34073 RepID=UPI0006E6418C|nr:(2Fe-2S)-binding protein [Variovorax paradoxus]KPU88383.1 (2Fe-2S)-binding protein [Variovorax paradoxus]KPU88592.1 (2Fe-2S)-binding protein [Variovorax paradoxus]KPV02966.1 (2Fe-2S)-binding protein [Variovorax paradoxus]KPV15128.1 (2Fe-2S)-binding protein [Variovorax paradoxus]
MKVRLEPSGLAFETEAGTSVLKAAEAAGIEMPSSCPNGTCRTCICRLLEGEARHTIEWPGLSAEEKAERWILPCVAEALGDIAIDAPQAFSLFDDA